MPKRLEFIENEAFVLTVTVKRRGTGAGVNLDVYDDVSLQIHDKSAVFGTNLMSLTGTPDADQSTNPGKVTFTITQTVNHFGTGETDFSGYWSIQCKTTDLTLNERTFMGECIIHRNPFVAI